MRLKLIILTLLSVFTISFCKKVKAQDSLQTSARYRINWLIQLTKLDNATEARDSIKARGYLEKWKPDKDTTLVYLFRSEEKEEGEYAVLYKKNDGIIGCGYSTSDQQVYKQMMAELPKMGFKSFDRFSTEPNEHVFYKEGIIFTVMPKPGSKSEYVFAATKL